MTRSKAVVILDDPLIERITIGTNVNIKDWYKTTWIYRPFWASSVYSEPEMVKLKGCALFWEKILVYEGYLQHLSEFPWLVEFVFSLFKNDLLRVVQTPEGLRDWLHDRVPNYTKYGNTSERPRLSSRENLWCYLHENADKVVIQPSISKRAEKVIAEASEKDYQDKKLRKLYDSIVNERIIQSLQGPFTESARHSAYRYVHSSRDEKIRYNFENVNRTLLEQLTIGSALCTDSVWTPIYRYKLGEYHMKDAATFLEGLDVIVPFAQRNSICEFSLDEILKLRRNKSWNKAMNKLADLCYNAKMQTDTATYHEQLTLEVIKEYQNALEEERMTRTGLMKTVGKSLVYSGISLFPIIGELISTTIGTIDPIVNFLRKEEKQRNLPFFLNDMRETNRA